MHNLDTLVLFLTSKNISDSAKIKYLLYLLGEPYSDLADILGVQERAVHNAIRKCEREVKSIDSHCEAIESLQCLLRDFF